MLSLMKKVFRPTGPEKVSDAQGLRNVVVLKKNVLESVFERYF